MAGLTAGVALRRLPVAFAILRVLTPVGPKHIAAHYAGARPERMRARHTSNSGRLEAMSPWLWNVGDGRYRSA